MITSASNRRIKEIQALITRKKERTGTGLFTAEGIKIFQETPGSLIESVYVSESFEKENRPVINDVRYEVLADHLFERICDTKSPQGILSVIRQPAYKREDLLGKGTPFIILLEGVQDPGNVGTIIRTAEGAGASGIIFTGGCADLFAPKTIRSTMGSVFRIPFVFEEDYDDLACWFKKNNITSYGAHLCGKCGYTEPDYRTGSVLFIGNEGRGLSDELASHCDNLILIPMEGRLESLNAAVAAAVIMYKIHEKRNM